MYNAWTYYIVRDHQPPCWSWVPWAIILNVFIGGKSTHSLWSDYVKSCVLLLALLCKLESIIIVDVIIKRFAGRHIRRRQASTRCWASPCHNHLAATWPTILSREIKLRMEEEASYLETTGTRSLEQYSTAANLSSALLVATAWFEIFVGSARISEVFLVLVFRKYFKEIRYLLQKQPRNISVSEG